jgi:glycosyltransferase involved in cell wall biosynthesis
MLEHQLFNRMPAWHRRFRHMVLAVFSYRYDAELVPDLLANIASAVDGWVAFDDRNATDVFSNEPRRRQLLIERARELGATWVLGIDPDERIERGAATRIRGLTRECQRIVWEFNLREMFTPTAYRIDGIWGSKMQGRLFPVFDGPLCSAQPLHGSWCVAPPGYSVFPAGLNLYHLKMASAKRRQVRRDLYRYLDPAKRFQPVGYDYLLDEQGAELETIPPGRDFIPRHSEAADSKLHMADLASIQAGLHLATVPENELPRASFAVRHPPAGATVVSQMGQLSVSYGERANHDSKLAVVVIGLGAPKSLHGAVGSLLNQDVTPEIVVVNSGGGDARTALAGLHCRVTMVEIVDPVLVGAARNAGIQVSRAPFVAFLAADCIAAPGWVAERLRAHIDGNIAIGSVVENDKRGNPFAWAAHLMTYGHRMIASGGFGRAYGGSYDRTLFDKYGYFSETMMIGEDSELHNRFEPPDFVSLHPGVRTIHRNPGGPVTFLIDQWRRGRRGYLMAEFLRADFSLRYIAAATISRVVRSVHVSATGLDGRERLRAMTSWPVLPFGALAYLAGMITSYSRGVAAERYRRKAAASARSGRSAIALQQLRRAMAWRPVTAQYHVALATLLDHADEVDQSARELYAAWDIDRGSLTELYYGSISALEPQEPRARSAIGLEVVVFFERSVPELAELLEAINAQRANVERLNVFVVDASGRAARSDEAKQLRKLYSQSLRFGSPEELRIALHVNEPSTDHSRTWIVGVSSSSDPPPPDWLSVLVAYVGTYPEVEIFHGCCRPTHGRGGHLIESLSVELSLFGRTDDNGGALRWGRSAAWACRKSLLSARAASINDGARLLDPRSLAECIMGAGASSLYAPDWQMRIRADTAVASLTRSAYRDGYDDASGKLAMRHRDLAKQDFLGSGVTGSIAAAWRFAHANYRRWKHAQRNLLLHPPAFLLLLLAGASRQVGWLAGRRDKMAAHRVIERGR